MCTGCTSVCVMYKSVCVCVCGCTTENTTVLKGEKATVYNVMHVYSTVHTVHVYRICMYFFTV